MFYDDDLGTEILFFPVCLISEYASFTINVYLYSIHLGIWNVTAVFQFPFNTPFESELIAICENTGLVISDYDILVELPSRIRM